MIGANSHQPTGALYDKPAAGRVYGPAGLSNVEEKWV